MPQLDFAALAAALPSPLMVLDRELAYVWTNDSYLEATGRAREELIGRRLFDCFPSEGEPRRMLETSLRRVLETGEPDSLALIRYAIPRGEAEGGGFEDRWWSASHTPLKGPDGRVAYVLQNTVDVTELQRLRDAAGERHLFQRAREVQQAKLTLEAEVASLRDLFDQAPGFIALLRGPDHVFALANAAYQRLVGARDLLGRPVREALPETAAQGFLELLDQVYASGEAYVGRAVKVRLARTPGAALEDRYVDFVYQPTRDAEGKITGIFVEGSDVTERALAARHRELLLNELNHRVKNSLAVVQGLAVQSFREGVVTAEARRAFMGRLAALAAAHDVLTRTNWAAASLRGVVEGAAEPFGSARFQIDGPDLQLGPKAAISLAMVLHELATNAAKYGALSVDGGTVTVSWRADDEILSLCWKERGGPTPVPPTRRGFGTRLIERGLAGELGGEVRILFETEGVVCTVVAPLTGER